MDPAIHCRMLFRQEYLRRFAYLGDENPDPQMQELQNHPDEQFALAVRTFQRFAGLNETGNYELSITR